jgi:hypothetical protein
VGYSLTAQVEPNLITEEDATRNVSSSRINTDVEPETVMQAFSFMGFCAQELHEFPKDLGIFLDVLFRLSHAPLKKHISGV